MQGIPRLEDICAHELLKGRRARITLQVAAHNESDLFFAQCRLLFLCQTLLFVFEALECFSDVVSANEIARLLHDVERLSLANKVKPVSVVELRIAKDKFLRLVVD